VNFNKRYNLQGMPIGEGAFGKVYQGKDTANNNEVVAVKEVVIDYKNRMIAEI
jgi:serine/threonine protein kinase